MSGEAWDQMRKAKEDDYFERKNKAALERLNKKKEDAPRPSPITGEPMEQVVLHGVVIDRCNTSGGIWLDAGELEELVQAMSSGLTEAADKGVVSGFFKSLVGK